MDYFYSVRKMKYRSIFMSIRYSQEFKDSLVKFHQEGFSLKSLAEKFCLSKDSIAIWVKQAITVMINWKAKIFKNVKQLEKRLAIWKKKMKF